LRGRGRRRREGASSSRHGSGLWIPQGAREVRQRGGIRRFGPLGLAGFR
jgi:hypothetical protein